MILPLEHEMGRRQFEQVHACERARGDDASLVCPREQVQEMPQCRTTSLQNRTVAERK